MITFGVSICSGGLAQHVIAVGKPLGLHAFGAFHRLADIFAQHKLSPHFAHRAGHGGADHRLAQALDGAAQMAADAGLFIIQNAACEHQGPGRGIDQRRGGMAQMPAPV